MRKLVLRRRLIAGARDNMRVNTPSILHLLILNSRIPPFSHSPIHFTILPFCVIFDHAPGIGTGYRPFASGSTGGTASHA